MPRLNPALSGRRRWLLLPAALLALPLLLKALGVQPVNRASTEANHADAALRPRFYAMPPREVQRQVLALVPTLSTYGRAWRFSNHEADEANEGFVVRCEVPVLFFTDDLQVRIEAEAGGSRVHVESSSRVGQGDFGENARHIRQLLRALDERLA